MTKKRIITITAASLMLCIILVFSSILIVSGGTSKREVTDEELAAAEETYWTQYESRYQDIIKDFEELNSELSFEGTDYDDLVSLQILDEDTNRAIEIMEDHTGKYSGKTTHDLTGHKSDFYTFLLELCDLYMDASVPLSADEMAFIKNYVVYIGGPAQVYGTPVNTPKTEDEAVRENDLRIQAIEKAKATFGNLAECPPWGSLYGKRPTAG